MKNEKINLSIEMSAARGIWKDAPAALKTILESSAPEGFFSADVKDRINSYEDACGELGRSPLDEKAYFDFYRKQLRIEGVPEWRIEQEIKAKIAYSKLETITEAYNEGDFLDWNDTDQKKYYPYFTFNDPSGFAFDDADYAYWSACAGDASRLCFKTDANARDAGQKFAELYRIIIDNRPRA